MPIFIFFSLFFLIFNCFFSSTFSFNVSSLCNSKPSNSSSSFNFLSLSSSITTFLPFIFPSLFPSSTFLSNPFNSCLFVELSKFFSSSNLTLINRSLFIFDRFFLIISVSLSTGATIFILLIFLPFVVFLISIADF
uniref:Uncharacterized protein n=1 Tax=Meloidogyne enterolobii TaxID=390850 RepID=A0A6V7XZ58_MELEN|nr:unnamed protein product [Meloidogyne enterolobii]